MFEFFFFLSSHIQGAPEGNVWNGKKKRIKQVGNKKKKFSDWAVNDKEIQCNADSSCNDILHFKNSNRWD